MATKKDTTEKAPTTLNQSSVIIGPRVTEKAARGSEKGMYVFDVATSATKNEIAKAFKARYNVPPLKVRTILVRKRYDFKRGRLQSVRATKKAYVFVPKGTTVAL